MADEKLMCHCLEWTRQLIDKKQEVMVNIVVGGFTFSFDNKKHKEQKHKSPSQVKRNLDRQKEFERRFVKIENQEASENISAKENSEVETISVATQADLVTNREVETQSAFSSKDFSIQTNAEKLEYIEKLEINDKGEILPNHDENIIGPSGVRALPLAAGINVVAIVLGIIFLSFSLRSLLKTPEGVVVGF